MTKKQHEDYIPRLTVNLTPDEKKRLDKCVPWGYTRRLFSVLIDSVCTAVEKQGPIVLAAIVSKRIDVLDILGAEEKKEVKR